MKNEHVNYSMSAFHLMSEIDTSIVLSLSLIECQER